MASTRKDRSPVVRVAAIVAAALVVLAIVAYAVVGTTEKLQVGESAETDRGVMTVRGWETTGDETRVSVHACTDDAGSTVDLSALRVVVGDAEIEPSGSQLGGAEGGTSGTCVEGSVRFPTGDPVDEVRYLSSPRVVWRYPEQG